MEILHLARRVDWDAACATGAYRISTRGATLDEVCFIHASLRSQLPAVAEFAYRDETEALVILVMDDDEIRAAGVEVRYEDGGAGEHYPHIYGAIDPSWVHETRPAHFGEDGRLRF